MNKISQTNARTWDSWSQEGSTWTIPYSPERYREALERDLQILLTPMKFVPLSWYEGLGQKVLCLASGGGQQGPELKAHGYEVTVMDLSDRQLQADALVARREKYKIGLVKADMSVPFPFADESFDFIVHPVSNCYVEELDSIWQEAYRVLKAGGALMSGWTNPIMYMVDDEALENPALPLVIRHALPYNSRLLEQQGHAVSPDSGYQFSHTLEAQIGGQLRAGFLLKDFYEDSEADNQLAKFTSLYAATLAIKPRILPGSC